MSGSDRPVLCIVGAGTAGLEALLAARQRLGTSIELRLIAPDREFHYRPIGPRQPFRPVPERTLRIADVTAELAVDWRRDRVAAIHGADRQLLTRDGDLVDFDYLLIAAGVSSHRTLHQGEVWQRDHDARFLEQIIDEMLDGGADRVALVIPRGARWPVPAYELALVLAWRAAGTRSEITLITSEQHPLAGLGTDASNLVLRELLEAGVHLEAGIEVFDAPREGAPHHSPELVLVPECRGQLPEALTGRPADPARVRLGSGDEVEFDRLVSLPAATGPAIAGVPTDACGFIAVDEAFRVRDSRRIWAAGSCIAAALERCARRRASRRVDRRDRRRNLGRRSARVLPILPAPGAHRDPPLRTARAVALGEPARDPRDLDALPVVASRASRRAPAGATHLCGGSLDAVDAA